MNFHFHSKTMGIPGTKFLIIKFLITEFLITKFLITEFLITKFLITHAFIKVRPLTAPPAMRPWWTE
jgi:hypothetical protein